MNEHDEIDVPSAQETEVQRYVDHELDDSERAAFEGKLLRDAALRKQVDGLRSLREVFRPSAAETAPQPSAGFRARVLARAATAAEPESVASAAGAETDSSPDSLPDPLLAHLLIWAKRSLIAAAVIAGLSLLVLTGALRSADSGRLEASEDEVQKAMAAMDAQMRDSATAPSVEGR